MNLIHKYNLTSKSYCDNRTISEMEAEVNVEPHKGVFFWSDVKQTLLSGEAYKHNNHLYSLSREAIKQWEKEND